MKRSQLVITLAEYGAGRVVTRAPPSSARVWTGFLGIFGVCVAQVERERRRGSAIAAVVEGRVGGASIRALVSRSNDSASAVVRVRVLDFDGGSS